MTCEWLFPPETVAGYDVADTVELFHLVNEQDFAATEACQPNMKSRGYAKGGVLVPLEQEIIGRWYYQWYRDSMGLPARFGAGSRGIGLQGAGERPVTAFATRAVHAGNDPAAHNGAVTTPIYQASTFVRPRARPVESGWDYSRIANPTRADLEECLAALEGGASAVAVASGMAACVTVIQALGRSGGHVVIPDNVYGGTWDLVHEVYQRWGLAYTAVNMADLDAVAAAIRPETTLVWAESPSNPLLKITDIPAVADLAHRAGALLVVDGTFASPYLQQPIALGADLVIHSTTKYLGGHSDITGGAVIAAASDLGAVIGKHVGMLGTGAAPQEAWLVRRGIKSLPVRMRQICASSQRIAEYLAGHPAVERVHYPGLPDHPGPASQ